ncbi:MAG: ribonuclease III [Pseudomonadota bacterium]
MTTLSDRIAYKFSNPALLQQALCHRSAGKPHNERLEFLGDAVLGFVVSDLLYQRFPTASEGELSRLRSQLVQRSTLAEIARTLRLGDELKLGPGELKSGGAQRESILADAMEALVSALYLDGGLAVCTAKLEQWLAPRMSGGAAAEPNKDAKTRLQEWLQARKQPLPAYTVANISGSDHQQNFTIICQITRLPNPVSGTGSSRKEAEQVAAALALEQLESQGG